MGQGVQGTDPGARHPQRDQVRLFAHWIRALRKVGLPHLQDRLEDGKGDWWQENGRPSLFEVERDGRVRIPATAASGLRLFQIARVFPESLSWMETVWSRLARWSRVSRSRTLLQAARRSEQVVIYVCVLCRQYCWLDEAPRAQKQGCMR